MARARAIVAIPPMSQPPESERTFDVLKVWNWPTADSMTLSFVEDGEAVSDPERYTFSPDDAPAELRDIATACPDEDRCEYAIDIDIERSAAAERVETLRAEYTIYSSRRLDLPPPDFIEWPTFTLEPGSE